MKNNRGWNRFELKTWDEIRTDEFAWAKGFFHLTPDLSVWKRNYTELKQRDFSLFALGDVKGKNVLDVGSGEGLYMLTFSMMGAAYVAGQDISPEFVEKSIAMCQKHNFKCDAKVGDCTELKFADNAFDFVFSGDVFEHITEEQKDKCLAEIYRVLKPGGSVTIKTPNLDYLKTSLFVKRIIAVLKFRNPFSIHIEHTRNNPSSEHIGLTTFEKLRRIFLDNTFHEPQITFSRLERKGVPEFLSKLFERNKFFNENLIMTARKPIFFGLYK